jgi:hypothetical protein
MRCFVVSSDRWEHSQIGDATPQILKFAFMAPLLMNAGRAIAGQGIKQMGKVGVKQGLKNMASKKGLKELASSALEGKGKEMAMDAVTSANHANQQKQQELANQQRDIANMGRTGAGTTTGQS